MLFCEALMECSFIADGHCRDGQNYFVEIQNKLQKLPIITMNHESQIYSRKVFKKSVLLFFEN